MKRYDWTTQATPTHAVCNMWFDIGPHCRQYVDYIVFTPFKPDLSGLELDRINPDVDENQPKEDEEITKTPPSSPANGRNAIRP
ncbi:hypothetical protein TELCIR_08244, partial [Teladorsagia circumcincta]